MPEPRSGALRPPRIHPALGLALLLALAVALRVLAWVRSAALFNDGPRFLRQAQLFDAGEWMTAVADAYHPLYALAIVAARRAGAVLGVEGSWEATAVGVSIAGGAIALVCLWGFVRDAFGGPYAWIAGALFAVHSRAIEYTSDVQSEGLYLAWYLAGVWLAWRALARRSAGYALAAGFAAGAAYATRPEGLGLVLVTGGVMIGVAWRQGWGLAAAARGLAALVVGAALWVVPYTIVVHAATGTWSLTQKKPVSEFLGAGGVGPAAMPHATGTAALRTDIAPLPRALGAPRRGPADRDQMLDAAADFFDTLRSSPRSAIWIVILWGAWIAVRRDGLGLRGCFIAAIAAAYTVVLARLVLEAGYVSRRHALPPFLPAFGYAAIGTHELGRWLGSGWARWRGTEPVSSIAAALAGCAVMAAISLSHQWEARRLDKLAERRAAEWLADRHPGGDHVAGSGARIGYYSRMAFSDLTRVDPAKLSDTLIQNRVDFAIVNRGAFVEALRADPRFELLHREEIAGERAFVFRAVVPRAGTP